MPATAVFPENYCVCVGEDGAPREIGRSGAAVTYKAMGYQSGQPVALQLIPLATVSEAGRGQFELKARGVSKLKHPNIARVYDVRAEDDHLVFASEYLQGETAEQWVVAHGPMPPAAAVRIGLQVVSALAEAAFHSLSHRAIQPSNLMIVSGAAPDGDWPFVKLLNFGLAGLKLYSEGTNEVAPPMGAAFASPEQIETGKVDFRSEIFSLGATICFLLTGAVPTAGRARRSGEGERVLPPGTRIPRSLRKLLRRMLRIDPAERPRDPLLLTDELRHCLQKVERRRAFTRAAPLPVELEAPPVPRSGNGWLGPILTAATVLLLLGALAVVLLPGQVRWWTHRDRSLESIGVPIGVPENPPAVAQNSTSPSTAANAENSSTGPAAASAEKHPGPIEQLLAETASSPPPALTAAPEGSTSPAVAQNSPVAEATVTPAAEIAYASPAPAKVTAEQSPTAAIAQTSPAENAAQPPPAPSENSAENTPPLIAQESATPTPAESRAQSEVVVNNRMAEPPPPAEAPPPETVAQQPAVAQEQASPQQTEENEREPAGSENVAASPSPPPKVTGRAQTASTAAKPSRDNPIASRRAARAVRQRVLPPMRVGTEQAQFVRTTEEGKWVLRLPSGERVVTPPLPRTNVSDAPVISHRKVRKVQVPPRALPADDGPPVVVLPPQD